MYELKLKSRDMEWEPLDFAGVAVKPLRVDPETGAMTVLTRMGPGTEIPAHRHSAADETAFVVEGDFVEDGERFGPGACFHGAAGSVHGPHRSAGGCVLLTHFTAKLDFLPVD